MAHPTQIIGEYKCGSQEVKDVLERLFPEIVKFNWRNMFENPFKHFTITDDTITPSDDLLEACERKGHPIPAYLWPSVTLAMLPQLFSEICKAYNS